MSVDNQRISALRHRVLLGRDAVAPRITNRTLVTGEVRLRVTGEIDRDNAPALHHRLCDVLDRVTLPPTVTLDLSGVPLSDTAGARALAAVAEFARSRGSRLRLALASPLVRHTLTVCGLGPLLE
ncbi:STAS domain-containing protein [Catenuloplanes sp. NPDC051500]|uniref:STAS domain-containing protein n=1 Tax=Catenuloplanes sp. NPDC051500 TaxID=3363959 RepID=UPI00378D6C11